MIQELHIFVTGKVQGVGFRAAVKKQALLHHINGFTRNLPDGRVEICAQGKEDQIFSFLEAVESRPGLGSISHIEKIWKSVQRSYSTFEIII